MSVGTGVGMAVGVGVGTVVGVGVSGAKLDVGLGSRLQAAKDTASRAAIKPTRMSVCNPVFRWRSTGNL